jgi:undecaprenyl pyrophosphate synthase
MTLTIAVAYGGRDEIVDAVRSLLAEQAERGLTVGKHPAKTTVWQ